MNIFYKSTRRLFARNFKVNMEKYIPNYKQIVSKEKELKDKVVKRISLILRMIFFRVKAIKKKFSKS